MVSPVALSWGFHACEKTESVSRAHARILLSSLGDLSLESFIQWSPCFSWFVDKQPTSIKYARICLQNSVFLRKQAMTAGSAITGLVGSRPALAFLSPTGMEGSVCWFYLDLKGELCEL